MKKEKQENEDEEIRGKKNSTLSGLSAVYSNAASALPCTIGPVFFETIQRRLERRSGECRVDRPGIRNPGDCVIYPDGADLKHCEALQRWRDAQHRR